MMWEQQKVMRAKNGAKHLMRAELLRVVPKEAWGDVLQIIRELVQKLKTETELGNE